MAVEKSIPSQANSSSPAPLIPEDGVHTVADLKYFTPVKSGERPYEYIDPVQGKRITNVEHQILPLKVYDLRPLVDAGREHETNVDITGFQIVPKSQSHTSMTFQDWENDSKIKTVYYAEVEELLKNVTGATKVIIFDHTIRRQEKAGTETPDTTETRKPVSRVHIDQTPASGRKRVYRHGGADAERLLRGKAKLINIWRPLRGPVYDTPLAMADARSLNPETDLVPSRLIYEPPTPEGETYQVAHNKNHRWYYLSEMTPDEALLLKCWDNDEKGGARTPHTAFVDKRYYEKEGVLPRQSIEVRALVFHEPTV